MANEEHLDLLRLGVDVWNDWRNENFGLGPDFRGADLKGVNLGGADLSWVNLSKADLRGANLSRADLSWVDLSRANLAGANLAGANLSRADLRWVNLSRANLKWVNLSRADLSRANLSRANLRWADLSEANLRCSLLSGTNLENANLKECLIDEISAWNLKLEGANQSNLIVTPPNELTIMVDNLEVALFIGLLLNSHKIRDVINTITSKIVLILGCFTSERKAFLDSIREVLRSLDYLPVVFNFDKAASRDITESISCMASMAQFIIADITDAKSILQELQSIVPHLTSVPVQPLLHTLAGDKDAMFEPFQQYPWVLEAYQYDSLEQAIASLNKKIIALAEAKARELLSCNYPS